MSEVTDITLRQALLVGAAVVAFVMIITGAITAIGALQYYNDDNTDKANDAVTRAGVLVIGGIIIVFFIYFGLPPPK